jgi:hypothetical protein
LPSAIELLTAMPPATAGATPPSLAITSSIVVANYYDDNGVHNQRVALVFENSLVLTRPQPPYEPTRR